MGRLAIYILLIGAALIACSQPEGRGLPAPDCDIHTGPCVKQEGGLTAEFEIFPRPVRAMRELSFALLLEQDGRPVEGARIEVDFTMPGMYMGVNRHTLEPVGEGAYRAEGVLPRCPQGGRLWQAEVIIHREGHEPLSVFYLFEVQ